MSWEGLQGQGVRYEPSPVETERFGLTLGRVVVGFSADETAAAEDLARHLKAVTDEVLVVRWPSRMVALGGVLAQSDRAIIPADVLTYWEGSPQGLAELPVGGDDAGLHLRTPKTADSALLTVVSRVVESSFRGYGSHYLSNPALNRDAALAGYVEWARRTVTAERGLVVLLERDAQAVGVATCEVSSDGEDLEVLLAGLSTHSQGRGWYRRLLVGVGEQAVQRGCRRVIISTQAHNVRVQRVWGRAGLVPFAAVTTAHAVRRPVAG